jgi:hypothetical protein
MNNSFAVTGIITFLTVALSSASTSSAGLPDGFEAADSMSQEWQITHQDSRLKATGSISVTGKPGDRFVLLKAPAILSKFTGEGLRLSKQEIPGEGLCYVISIPFQKQPEPAVAGDPRLEPNAEQSADRNAAPDAEQTSNAETNPEANQEPTAAEPETKPEPAPIPEATAAPAAPVTYKAEFEYHLEAVKSSEGVAVLTGTAAVQEISLTYDEAGWEIAGSSAVRVEHLEAAGDATQAKLLLGPAAGNVVLKPKSRDVASEKVEPSIITAVNLGDFDATILPNPQTAQHCVYRYGTDGGELAVRVAPVA